MGRKAGEGVDMQNDDVKQLNDELYSDSLSRKKPSFGKKALSIGLITAFLGLYPEANKLFGKTEDVKQVYPVVQTLPAPRRINIPDVKTESVDVPYPPKSFRYDLNTHKLIPIEEYEQEKVQENKKTKDGEPEAKKEKKGTWFGRNWYYVAGGALLVADLILDYAPDHKINFVYKKKTTPPVEPPIIPPEEKPDVTVVCYNLNGVREQGSRVILDGNYYDTSNGEVTVKDIAKGSHSFDYEDPDVYSQWLIVRNSLNGTNMQQKDVVDTNSDMSITSDTTLYLIKIPKNYKMTGANQSDLENVSFFTDRDGGGMYKFDVSTLPVVVDKQYTGDTTKAESVLDSNISQQNAAQQRGEFGVRMNFERQASANNPRIDLHLKNIMPQASGHGESLSGYQITNTNIDLTGIEKYVSFETTNHEMFEGTLHIQGYDDIVAKLVDGEFYGNILSQLGKDVRMVSAHFNPGTRFKSGSSSAQSLSTKKINKNKPGDYDTPSLDLKKEIEGIGDMSMYMSGRGNDKRIGFGGRFNIGNGNATLNVGSDGVVARIYQKLLGNDINVSYINGLTSLDGGFNVSKKASMNVYIPDMKNPTNAFLAGRYKGKDIDATIGIRPGSLTVRTAVNIGDDIDGVLDFYKDRFGSRTLVGFSYDVGKNTHIVASASLHNDGYSTKLDYTDVSLTGKFIDNGNLGFNIGIDSAKMPRAFLALNYQF